MVHRDFHAGREGVAFITVNGVQTPALRGATDMLVLSLPPGSSVIELHDGATPIRQASALASLFGLLAIAGLTAALAVNDRRVRAPIPARA